MLRSRPPSPVLAPFVERLWVTTPSADAGPCATIPRELALPTGSASLVFRLVGPPVRVFHSPEDVAGDVFGHAVVSGVRDGSFVREGRSDCATVGAHFRPGGLGRLLGLPEAELAGRHTPLADLWGARAESVRDALAAAPTPGARLRRLERLLERELATAVPLHPSVAHVLARIDAADARTVTELAKETGWTTRHVNGVFRRAIGLSPRTFARVRRFGRTLERLEHLEQGPDRRGAALAAACGYFDQSHLVREFRAFLGLPPGAYRPLLGRPFHVPLGDEAWTSRSSKRGARLSPYPRGS